MKGTGSVKGNIVELAANEWDWEAQR